MVEFVIGRNISAKNNKVIAAEKPQDIIKLLGKDEAVLQEAIKKQKPEDKIKEYNK